MKVWLNRVHFPVTALGPGRRLGIWLQGCSLACPGCVSRDTWTPTGRHETSVEALLARCETLAPGEIDGVTISGGEPFEQPEALAALLRGLAARRAEQARPMDLLVYSGLRLATLQRRHAPILALADAVISEPFVSARAPGDGLRGSSNQLITPLSALGAARYGGTADAPGRRMQVAIDEEAIWFIGIPGPGDMARLEDAARRRGLELESCSWRA